MSYKKIKINKIKIYPPKSTRSVSSLQHSTVETLISTGLKGQEDRLSCFLPLAPLLVYLRLQPLEVDLTQSSAHNTNGHLSFCPFQLPRQYSSRGGGNSIPCTCVSFLSSPVNYGSGFLTDFAFGIFHLPFTCQTQLPKLLF